MNKLKKDKLKAILAIYAFARAMNDKQKKQIIEDTIKNIEMVFNK